MDFRCRAFFFYALRAPICVSAVAEEQKMGKTVFRPWPKSENREKLHFGRGRKMKNKKSCVSAMAEEQETRKTGRRRPTKCEKR